MKEIKRYNGTEHRVAVITDNTDHPILHDRYPFAVYFYYDGMCDYEWKRGSHGIACDLCETLEQATGKARRYVKKDFAHEM